MLNLLILFLVTSCKFVDGLFLILGFFVIFIPIPVIKNFLSFTNIISCKIPLIFFLSISKSFGFLKKIFLLVNLESNFLTKRQLILVIVLIDKFFWFNSLKKETNKFPFNEIHFLPTQLRMEQLMFFSLHPQILLRI